MPTLLTFHTRLASPMPLPNLIFRTLDALVVRPILNYTKPQKTIAIDTVFYDYIKDRYGIPESRIDAIPVGVELDRFEDLDHVREEKQVRERFDLGKGPLIVSLGHVIPMRDRVDLIKALPAVLARNPETKVLVVGGVYYQEFLKQARELKVEHAVVCAGALPKTDIPGILAARQFAYLLGRAVAKVLIGLLTTVVLLATGALFLGLGKRRVEPDHQMVCQRFAHT